MSFRFDPDKAPDRLKKTFAETLAENPRGGASLAAWRDGRPWISLHGGESSPGIPWIPATPCLIWSASKGVAAAVTLHALQEKDIPLETPVSELWPEFAASGKERITLAELLSHRAGLAAINRTGLAITDHEAVAEALAAQAPNWKFDGSHGYGARTFGFLLDEIVRRIAGEALGSYWKRVFHDPLGIDLWFGLPPGLIDTAATVIAPKVPPAPGPFTKAFGDPSSLTRRALSEPNSAQGTLTPAVMNTAAMRSASLPSLGAIATGDSLARFYSLLTKPGPLFRAQTLSLMNTTLARGLDRTLLDQTAFSAGFMTNDFGAYGPSASSFGHPGAGGAIAFADPEHGLGFAYIPSAMHPGALPGARTQKLVRALYGTEEQD
jgi:CubicO group peptidase (beta-lactamase class C family)